MVAEIEATQLKVKSIDMFLKVQPKTSNNEIYKMRKY